MAAPGTSSARANRLANATSPYLLQHARNPVDWYEWGPEALARARDEDRPILLSIGYAACHWCHVMERESFEDEDTARAMNERFVCVKVDREERPDLDAVYMTAVQAMTGHGGWPMTMFATPDGRPFFGGTYFPPEPRHGMPAFRQVLDAVHDAWINKREDIEKQSAEITEYVARASRPRAAGADALGVETTQQAARGILESLDAEWGGFGAAPKFPQPMTLEFLLRMHLRGAESALDAVTLTLDKMARGGIFDQVGGGFHRYSVDRVWLVPHFEKMLYDNAQLLRLYARAWQVTGRDLYRDTAIKTGEWMLREMRHPDGGFYSSLDADSEGVEGKFYVWPYEELIAVAGDDMPLVIAAFAASGDGNFEGANIPWRPVGDDEVAAAAGTTPEELNAAVARASAKLLEARRARVRPATDDKVLASWNGLAIAGLAEAGRTLGRPDFVDAAERAAEFVTDVLRAPDGRLLRAWRDGRTSGPAFLDDHAMLADGLLTLYETTFDVQWYEHAMRLARAMVDLFFDPEGGFFDTGADADALVVRPKDIFDNALASGNSAASDVLLRLAALAGDQDLEREGLGFLQMIQPAMAQQPLGFGAALSALDRHLGPATEIAIVGDLAGTETARLVEVATARYLPNRVLAAGPPGSEEPALLRGRPLLEAATAYVCEHHTCLEPVTAPAGLERLLQNPG
jgi:uncharacterized protein YyaL (SSP411 family)